MNPEPKSRRPRRLAEFDAVLRLEMTAREIIGAGKGYEGQLALLVERLEVARTAGASAQSASSATAPVGALASGRGMAMCGRDS